MQITKFLHDHTYSGLVFVLLFSMLAFHVNKPDSNIEQRVSDLENRVALLEENLSESDTIDSSGKGYQYRENWRQLREGMSQDKVKELLGTAQRVDGGSLTIWHYSMGGRIMFRRGRVHSWHEPY